jgi:hypothetical protein
MLKNLKKNTFFQSNSFLPYLMKKEQKIELYIFIFVYVLLFFLLSFTYPYPALTADSGNYVVSAKTMTINGFRPMGYSWFINFFHLFSTKISTIFLGQFLINMLAQVTFIFSVKYLFQLKKIPYYTFSVLFVLSPSILFCTNYLMSDSIFNSLTIIYLTTALWIIKKPNGLNITLHLILLYFVINVRYAALFYPILSVGIFLLHIKKHKVYTIAAILPILISFHIFYSGKSEVNKVYGINEFSGFSGWATANNAVAIIPYIDLKPNDIEDKEIKFFHQVMTSYPDSIYAHKHINATDFMWKRAFPGKEILKYTIETQKYSYTKSWIYLGQKYKKYALFLIKRYPLQYFKYYLFPNFKQLFYSYKIPHVKKFTSNKLYDSYFNLKSEKYDYQYSFIHKFNPIRKLFIPILWFIFLLAVIILFVKRKLILTESKNLILFLLLFIIFYAGFSIIAHPINNFRYLIPIYSIQLLIPCIVCNKLLAK